MREIDEDSIKNIQDFFEQYGAKEFITIYLQQILLEMYKVGVHSSGRSSVTDLVHQYFFTENGEVRSPQEIDTFDEAVEERCFELASNIVQSLGSSFFDELPDSAGDFNPSVINQLNQKLQKAIKKHLEVRWG